MKFFKVLNSDKFGEILLMLNPALEGCLTITFVSDKGTNLLAMAALVDSRKASMEEMSQNLEATQLSDVLPMIEECNNSLHAHLAKERNTDKNLN